MEIMIEDLMEQLVELGGVRYAHSGRSPRLFPY